MKILVVEDEKKVASFLKKGLEQEYYSVDVAFDGKEGLNYIFSNEYDLIILDIIMPGVSGIDMLKELACRNKTFPVIVLRGSVDLEEYIDDLRKMGYDESDTLLKPIDLNELLGKIRIKLKKG